MGGKGGRRAVLIAGPTASGKSALAAEIAAREGGVVVNADAMQVYEGLAIVTARPGPEAEALTPHRLYGFVSPAERFSTGRWLAAVEAAIAGELSGRPLIFVGGTGLYFDSLTSGFAEVPPVPPEIALEVQQEIQALDAEGRMRLLAQEDPEALRRIGVADPQRVMRAVAVRRATGRTLSSFQSEPRRGLVEGFSLERMVLDPDRDVLAERIARRAAAMLEEGAVGEVKALLARGLDPSLPAMKAIGVPEIAAWLGGELDRETALERMVVATRQYAKRQRTWLRNRMGDWPRVPA